jgi:hypothetical protein
VAAVLTALLAAALISAPAASAMDGRVPDGRAANAAGEITAMYWHGLNRDPDPAGFSQYLNAHPGNCRWTVLSASYQILTSSEAQGVWHNNAQTEAGMLYAALLNRPPDPGGMTAYTAGINMHGLYWATASMLASPEYNARLARICPYPNEDAVERSPDNAQALARNILANNVVANGTVCAFSKGLSQLGRLKNSETPWTALLGYSATISTKIGSHLDGSCGATVKYIEAAKDAYFIANGNHPVFTEYYLGKPHGFPQQRTFVLRVGPDPAHWTAYSGSTR